MISYCFISTGLFVATIIHIGFTDTTTCVAVYLSICFSTLVSIYFIPYFLCPAYTTIDASKDNQPGSSTIDKRNRKKRKRIDVGLGPKQTRPKSDDADIKEIWNNFLAKRAFDQGFKLEGECQP